MDFDSTDKDLGTRLLSLDDTCDDRTSHLPTGMDLSSMDKDLGYMPDKNPDENCDDKW